MTRTVVFGDGDLSVEDVEDLALGRASAALSASPGFEDRMHRGTEFLDRLLSEDGVIYGVTTGYGDSCTVGIPESLVAELPYALVRFHGCGMGRMLEPELARAVIVARTASLCRGYSGVSMELLRRLVALLQHDIVPEIPEEGSVGASGDLTPLSYLAACLVGERTVIHAGVKRPAREALAAVGLDPYRLRPKEGLALMNGTAVMTALACIAYQRADYLARLTSRLTAICTLALRGNVFHFSRELFEVKPHPGQAQVAAWIRCDLEHRDLERNPARLQDRYSLRCAPHVIGVLADALPFLRTLIETELNSSNDNPIIDPDRELVLHGGHFYGGHIAFAMDALKTCVANIADLMDRQLALLVDTRYNNGLPANLSGAAPGRAAVNHGLKAVQIGVSAWTAEALKMTMPASVFSRSTECHNQDKVSMGTIAARDCLRILELTGQVASAHIIATMQAMEIRLRCGEISESEIVPAIRQMQESVTEICPFIDEDRALDGQLRRLTDLVRQRHWPLYPDA